MQGCQTKDPNLVFILSMDTLLSPITAMPGQIADFSIINPLEKIATKLSQPKLYMVTITIPVVISTIGIFSVIIMCSMNSRWYNFIQHRVSRSQQEAKNSNQKDNKEI
jgi:hypothetical protein